MRISPFILLLAIGGSVPLGAAVIASDDFEGKTLGDLDGQGGGSGFVGIWSADTQVDVVSSTLSYSGGSVGANGGGQALQIAFTNADIVDNLFSRSFDSSYTGTVYLSFLFREITNPDFGTDFIQVGFENTSPAQPLVSTLRRGGAYQVRSGTSSPAGNTVGTTIADFDTHLLVLKAEKNASGTYNRISLFIDPTSLSEPGSATEQVNASSGLSTVGLLTARSAFHAAGDTVQIDNLLVGDSWADVVTAIPEPSAALLILLAGLGLLRRRR